MMYIGLSMVKRGSEKLSKSNPFFFPIGLFLMVKILFRNIPKYIPNGIPYVPYWVPMFLMVFPKCIPMR
jgi:hypothetical protein